MTTEQTIPVADLADYQAGGSRQQKFVRTVGDALVDIGFFALTGHGVDMGLIDQAYKVAEQFFELPETTKRQYEVKGMGGQRGYTSFGKEHAKDSKAPDLKEFWHVGQELPAGHPLASVYPKNFWPEQPPRFKATFLPLFEQLERCAMQLLEACALYIEEPKDRFSKTAESGNTILRVIHYPPVPADKHPESIRAAAHEDINLITLLCEATAGGLELLERNGSWRKISALKGQIIVDAGDMLQNITNGYFKSTTHRVVNPDNSRERRFSMPYFVHPRSEVSLEPLPSCVARTGGTRKHPAITAGDYLQQRLREIGLAK
jgi:isopenicillin N synthase-like dioxygenase